MSRAGRGVLDTNAVILLERLDPDELPAEPAITVISLAELSVGPLVADDPQERAARQLRLQEVEAAFEPLVLDAEAARHFGRVAADLRRSGHKTTARAFDAMIAAIALANGLDVYTCSPDDFAGIGELEILPLTHPSR